MQFMNNSVNNFFWVTWIHSGIEYLYFRLKSSTSNTVCILTCMVIIIFIEMGKVIFEEDTNAAGFVRAISSLKASGGGDCPEFAMTGIINAIDEGPEAGSPMYVFTDASAKDASEKNIRGIITMAKMEDITINFYTTGKFATILFFLKDNACESI